MEGPERSEFLLDLSEFNMGAVLYNALLENSTSELGSRMQSMENSTKNAKDMLEKLTLLYNARARLPSPRTHRNYLRGFRSGRLIASIASFIPGGFGRLIVFTRLAECDQLLLY